MICPLLFSGQLALISAGRRAQLSSTHGQQTTLWPLSTLQEALDKFLICSQFNDTLSHAVYFNFL